MLEEVEDRTIEDKSDFDLKNNINGNKIVNENNNNFENNTEKSEDNNMHNEKYGLNEDYSVIVDDISAKWSEVIMINKRYNRLEYKTFSILRIQHIQHLRTYH